MFRKIATNVSLTSIEWSGADPGFSFRGGAKDCACTHIMSAKPKVDYRRGPGPWKLLEGFRCSLWKLFEGLDALLCYLSLILKHSDTKWDTQKIRSFCIYSEILTFIACTINSPYSRNVSWILIFQPTLSSEIKLDQLRTLFLSILIQNGTQKKSVNKFFCTPLWIHHWWLK